MNTLNYDEYKARCLADAARTYVRWGGKTVALSELEEEDQDFQIRLWYDNYLDRERSSRHA